jgi:hypothetical protein
MAVSVSFNWRVNMKTTVGSLVIALLAGMLDTTVLRAHHAHPDFALDRSARVEGTVVSVQFQNPHVLIRLRTADSTVYMAEWQGAQFLQSHPELVSERMPVRSTTLKIGDRVAIVGAPSRDIALRGLVNLKEVRRLDDGWVWQAR